ncbi:MAG: hypothetical protein CfP315_0469 [Candidatus Improbicoccus pseudotrichonymphae]|uniref:Riboflavin transporter n=1 Tax=Candidatus Improbicoccus pseudotrichonymphae TaxID=3033792 RepID=A0AA48KX15_9FIRM|nr:MAG: hypothetical protein CfP315_0469 [Candidatus Improbicoccus pseudotrichonymphae]
MKKNKIFKLTFSSFLGALSLLVSFFTFQMPFLPFLKLEISEFPIYYAVLVFETKTSMMLLFIVAFLKSFFLSNIGLIGFFIRMTLVFLIISVKFYKKSNSKNRIYFFLSIISIILFFTSKTLITYFLWASFNVVPITKLNELVLILALPVNIIKTILNFSLAIILRNKIVDYENCFKNNDLIGKLLNK